MKKILIINPFGIGDVLFSTPLLKAIKKRYPEAIIAYMCNKRTAGILKNDPNISTLYIFEKDEYRKTWGESRIKCLRKIHSLIKDIRKERYGVLVDMSLAYIYSLILWIFAKIPVRIGFNYRKRGRFLTHKIGIQGFNEKHVIEYYLELGKALGLDTQDKDMGISVAKEDSEWADKFLLSGGMSKKDRMCGIIPGCGASWGKDASYRRWPADKFARVADHFSTRHGYKTLIFGDSKEISLCSNVQSEMKTAAVQACGKTTLGQFAALLDRCDLVITNDGGPLHIAVALRKKTVSIFGPVDEYVYGPYPQSGLHIVITSDEPCRPCYKNFKYVKCETLNCLNNIKPDKVIKAAEALIG